VACRYDPYSPDYEKVPDIRDGRLTDAVISHDTPGVRILMAKIAAAPTAGRSCGVRESRFAVLTNFREHNPITEITVELGGCYRAVINTDPHHIRQLDADTVALLLGPPSVN
jgi:hypothetical protein